MLFKRILILAPHVDDETGCLGAVIKFYREHHSKIFYYALSDCKESVPKNLAKTILRDECINCLDSLSFNFSKCVIGTLPVRHFPEYRQKILEEFIDLKSEFNPDLVFIPMSNDFHQDHRVVYEEGIRAFKHTTLLGYELLQNTNLIENTVFIPLTEGYLDLKLSALSLYKSQEFRTYSNPEYVKSLAIIRGMQCNTQYAEAFEAIRIIF